jgi:hypothetical protein
MDLVTIKTYTYPQELAVVRTLLESEGIQTYSRDEMITQVDPFVSNAVGGVKLQVAGEDAPRALEIMLEKGFIEEPKTRGNTAEETLSKLLGKRLDSNFRVILIIIGLMAVCAYFILQSS